MRDLKAIELDVVFGGARVVDTSLLPRVQEVASYHVRLTPRQTQCLAWVAAGKTSREIGIALGLSFQTVDTYIKAACASLGVRTRAEAVGVLAKIMLAQSQLKDPVWIEKSPAGGEDK